MQDLLRIIGSPSVCGYLPWQTSSLEVRVVLNMTALEYAGLLARGYRRFGWQLFRPACTHCSSCRSLRVLAQQFTPNAGERRILRANQNIRAELSPLFASREHVHLFNRYQSFMHDLRGWNLDQCTLNSYRERFLSGAIELGRQWMYFDGDRLVGVAIMDQVPDAVSLVYFFHDPDWRSKSPGRFSIVNQLLYAKANALQYAYLGYWVEECQSLNYKNRFRPHEMLADYVEDAANPVWRAV